MTRPRLLDVFCGAGGCSVGYDRAGFDVVGVDIEPHADYPFRFVHADALDVLADRAFLDGFDVVHASPPCPRYSVVTPDDRRDAHPDLVAPVLDALRSWGGEWVVENVPGAPLPGATLLCGQAMGLRNVKRHRLFLASVLLLSPGCACTGEPVYGVHGDHGESDRERLRTAARGRTGKARDVEHARALLGAPWVTSWDDLTDLIPPAYAEYVGSQMLAALSERVA